MLTHESKIGDCGATAERVWSSHVHVPRNACQVTESCMSHPAEVRWAWRAQLTSDIDYLLFICDYLTVDYQRYVDAFRLAWVSITIALKVYTFSEAPDVVLTTVKPMVFTKSWC